MLTHVPLNAFALRLRFRLCVGTGAPSLRLRPRHVLHFGRVLSYGGQPRWSDLSFDGVDGIGLPPARYCYVANLELGLLPAER